MKITNKKIMLMMALLGSILWQPGHHIIMNHGMSMNSGIHVAVTIVPFLAFLFAFSKAKWKY